MDQATTFLCLVYQFGPTYYLLPREPICEAAYKHYHRQHCEAVAIADQFGHWSHADAVAVNRFAAAWCWAAWYVTWRPATREQRWQWSGVLLRMAAGDWP